MEKVKIRNLPFIYPLPAILVGTAVYGKANYATFGNCGVISVDPPVIYISSDKTHYTNIGIKENGYFSVNIPSVDLVKKVDYCGLVSGRHSDKSGVFTPFFSNIESKTEKIPMASECPLNLLCKVIKNFEVYSLEIFVAEVIEVYVSKECLTDGMPDTKKINPLIYMMDNLYWNIGSVVGQGFKDGLKYKSKL